MQEATHKHIHTYLEDLDRLLVLLRGRVGQGRHRLPANARMKKGWHKPCLARHILGVADLRPAHPASTQSSSGTTHTTTLQQPLNADLHVCSQSAPAASSALMVACLLWRSLGL
jgi:hypothetical protein